MKVLILTYFFPPCNLTAANRTASWARQLAAHGFYPIVVTRNWDVAISDQQKLSEPSGEAVKIEKREGYEVHFVPFKPGLRDRIYASDSSLRVLSKPLTLLEMAGQHWSSTFIPYKNLKDYADNLLTADQDLRLLVASAGPYTLFRFAWELKRKHPDLKWVADYRDDWSTKTLNRAGGKVSDVLHNMDAQSEKRWVASAAAVVSVSDVLTNRIASLTGVQGFTIPNGYDSSLMSQIEGKADPARFVISYSGYLYDTQPVEAFLEVVKRIAAESAMPILVRFIGLSYYKPAEQRVRAFMKGAEALIEITPRIPLNECIALEKSADLLLMMAYGDEKGIPASKVYQYIGTSKPVLLMPSDQDIIEEILSDTGQAVIPADAEDAGRKLLHMISLKSEGQLVTENPQENRVLQYSRKAQTEKLAKLLEQVADKAVTL